MSPARGAHDAPARRRRPSVAHERASASASAVEEPADDRPEDDQPEDDQPEDDEPEDDQPEDDQPEDDEPEDDEPEDDEPEDDEPEDDEPEDDEEADEPPSGGLDARDAARRAFRHLAELSSHTPEGVVGIEGGDDGWTVTIDVLEDPRVPSTSDVLAEYEVRLSGDGSLRGVTRGRRYVRGRTEQ